MGRITWESLISDNKECQIAVFREMAFLVFRGWIVEEMAARMDEGY